jgi:hypothetical protein
MLIKNTVIMKVLKNSQELRESNTTFRNLNKSKRKIDKIKTNQFVNSLDLITWEKQLILVLQLKVHLWVLIILENLLISLMMEKIEVEVKGGEKYFNEIDF